jgi:SAM-dependent methyltransferase
VEERDHEAKLERERSWYTEPAFRAGHPLNARLFYSRERNAFNYVEARRRLAALLGPVDELLVAPIGGGTDLPYLRPLAARIAGIDIVPEAVEAIADPDVEARVGDMLALPYADESFDAVAVSLFFHHYFRQGYEPYLVEIRRVLRPGGLLVTLEPSALHPGWWLSWALRRVVGNISGAVADERPIRASQLVAAMRMTGFADVQVEAAAFPHPRTPVPLARAINRVAPALVRLPLVKHLAWTFVARARKPG